MVDILKICNKVLERLNSMNYEHSGGNFAEQLIFPLKNQTKGIVDRISEQELRFLFVEEFKTTYPQLFYSVETPTEKKYKFGEKYEDIIKNKNTHKVSASTDMCIFKRNEADFKYERILNIEFKHENGALKNIAKDILKLIREKQDGVFIHLIKNSVRDTVCNDGKTGVFDKYLKAFLAFNDEWIDGNKSIQLVLISLKEKTLLYRKINKNDNLNNIFSFNGAYGNIKEVNKNEWKIEIIE